MKEEEKVLVLSPFAEDLKHQSKSVMNLMPSYPVADKHRNRWGAKCRVYFDYMF